MEYKSTYDKTFYEVQGKIKEALIKAKSESRTFNFTLNAIINSHQDLTNKSLIKSNKSLSLLELTYKKSISNYSENAIELALKNDIYPEYLKLNADELPPNYIFQNFVFDLGALQGLMEVDRLFRNHSRLFEMMFNLNDFSDFEIKEYEIDLDNTPIFKKLHKRLYPHLYVIEEQLKKERIISKDKLTNAELIDLKPIIDNIEKFTDNDKAFIYNLCLNEKYKIPMTEKVKLLLIAGEVHEINIYQFSKNFDTFYSKANKGIDYSSSINKTLSFLEQFIEKLSFFNLKETNEILTSLRINIIFENKRVLKQNKNQNN